jgi:multisubunit Na+/H+ antiporter MnhF subunit
MNVWLVAAIPLCAGFLPCLLAAARGDEAAGLPALSMAGVLTVALLIDLTEAFHRQPFMELALVLAALSMGGSLAFIRFLSRRR